MISNEICLKYFHTFKSVICTDAWGDGTQFVADENGHLYSLAGQDDTAVDDRINRSIEAGRNLFYQECEPYNQAPLEKGLVY